MTNLTPAALDDLNTLLALGRKLDEKSASLEGKTIRQFLATTLLKIRDKRGRLVPLVPNAAQLAFDAYATRRNIILKARQLGLTTYIAARYFLSAITRPGTVCVQVAHDQRSAEELFRIVHRFLENLPPCLRGEGSQAGRALAPGGISGALAPSRSNVRQIVFPVLDSEYRVESACDGNAGRGLTIHHLHCSEVARWSNGGEEALAALRAAVPPDGEIALESTPNGAGGIFYEEWQRAAQLSDGTGYQRHFFPWWLEASYVVGPRSSVVGQENEAEQERDKVIGPGAPPACLSQVGSADDRRPTTDDSLNFTDEEIALINKEGLREEQILFRRQLKSNFRQLAPQEFAEDAESCFLASGECVFDVDLVERRMSEVPAPAESRDNGRLLIWLPPQFKSQNSKFNSAGPTADDRRPKTPELLNCALPQLRSSAILSRSDSTQPATYLISVTRLAAEPRATTPAPRSSSCAAACSAPNCTATSRPLKPRAASPSSRANTATL